MGGAMRMAIATVMVVLLGAAEVAVAQTTARVGDVTHLKGQRPNRLIGMGLVVGLNGTGDGDDFVPAIRPLAAALRNLGNPVASADELAETRNVAVVMLDALIPETGVREGDRIDVQVSAFGAASSLEGGRLLVTPLIFHDRRVNTVFAYAAGAVHVSDAELPTTGVIKNGAVLEEDVLLGYAIRGRELPFANEWIRAEERYVTLVIDDAHAGWAMAAEIAHTIDSELSLSADMDHVALAADPKNVIVIVPTAQDPASWIADLEALPLFIPSTGARVTIDRTSGTIVVSGDARISPVVVSHKGLTVTVTVPEPEPDAAAPRVEQRNFVALDSATERAANVDSLLAALNRLSVPVEDRIAILSEIARAGKLHAKLMYRN